MKPHNLNRPLKPEPWYAKLSGTLIVAMVLQLLTTIWWAAALDTKVKAHEHDMQQLEVRLQSVAEELNAWEVNYGKR